MAGVVVMFQVPEKFRLDDCGTYSSDASYGNNGAFLVTATHLLRPLFAIAGDGCGWEHVSITVRGQKKRCPNWEEMCYIKSLFWGKEDTVVQFHPAESDGINMHPYCLHLWRPGSQVFPKPPKSFVGVNL